MNSSKIFIGIAALFGLFTVAIAAMSTHAIDRGLSAEALTRIDIGLKYQMFHIAALLGTGILASLHRNYNSLSIKISGICFILGILLFSGSLYAYAITDNPIFANITPFGGILFIIAWLFLFFYSFRK